MIENGVSGDDAYYATHLELLVILNFQMQLLKTFD